MFKNYLFKERIIEYGLQCLYTSPIRMQVPWEMSFVLLTVASLAQHKPSAGINKYLLNGSMNKWMSRYLLHKKLEHIWTHIWNED